MKLSQVTATLLLSAICCFADGVSPIGGTPFDTNRIEIVWNVPPNHLPPSVWVYKIVPQSFAPAIISNLVALGSFATKDQIRLKGQPPLSVYFKSKDGTREMGVVPTFGFIYYYNPKAEISGREIATNVPTKEEAFQLGVEYLQKLGIDRSQLATKGDSAELRTARDEGTRSWFDKERGTNFEQIYSRGIYFIRRINGIDFDGISHGGVRIEFGNCGQIARLEINWKGLEPYELYPTLTADQLIEQLRNGKGKWLPPGPGPVIKRLTIYDVQPLYRGVLEDDEQHNFLEPYIRLETFVDNGFTNIIADFDCPIINETKR